MRYRIGEFASLLGVSAETIRRYEQEGLIHAQRDQNNGYRYYKAADITLILRARMMRNLGISLRRTMTLFEGGPDDSRQAFSARIDEIDAQMHELELQRLNLARQLQELDECERALNRFELRRRPDFYVAYHLQRKSDTLRLITQSRAGEILEDSPFVRHFMHIPQAQLGSLSPEYRYGICIPASACDEVDPRILDECAYIPGRLCVYTVSYGSGEIRERMPSEQRSVLHGLLDGALAYMHEQNLRLTGDVTGNMLFIHRAQGSADRFAHYTQFWLPVD